MMLYRLVHLVETRSEELAACLIERVNDSEATPAYENLPADELRDRVYEIYRRLGEWRLPRMSSNSSGDICGLGLSAPIKVCHSAS